MQAGRIGLWWTEVAASLIGIVGFVATLVEPEWIERLFDEAPDGGDGSAERWLVGAAFLVAAVVAALLAHRERRRARLAGASR